jgi:hypothetical protein
MTMIREASSEYVFMGLGSFLNSMRTFMSSQRDWVEDHFSSGPRFLRIMSQLSKIFLQLTCLFTPWPNKRKAFKIFDEVFRLNRNNYSK